MSSEPTLCCEQRTSCSNICRNSLSAVYKHTVSAMSGGTLPCQILGYGVLSCSAESEETPGDDTELQSAQTEAVRWRILMWGRYSV